MQCRQSVSYYLFCAVAVTITGTALHFLYSVTGGVVSAVFGAVNESVFEHLKLLFWPALVFMIANQLIFRAGAFERQLRYLLIAAAFIVAVFYTYSGVLGFTVITVDILIYIAAVALFFILCYRGRNALPEQSLFTAVITPILVIAMITAIIAFTFNPPTIDLFRDPITGTYGIKNM